MILNEVFQKVVFNKNTLSPLELNLTALKDKDKMFAKACEIIDSEWEQGLLNKIEALRPDLNLQFDVMFESVGDRLLDDLIDISSFARTLSSWIQFSCKMCSVVKDL